MKCQKCWRMSSFSNPSFASPTSQALHLRHLASRPCKIMLILQHFRHFTYVTAQSATLPSLYLRHSSFSNPSVASPTSQLILRSFFRFSYVTGSSLTSPGQPPMQNNAFVIQFFIRTNYRRLKLLQVIYESSDCDFT